MTTPNDYAELGVDQAHAVYLALEAGDITPLEALRELAPALRAVDDAMQPLKERGEQLREWIGGALATLDPPAPLSIGGLTLELTRPSVTKGYDKKALDVLVRALAVTHPDVAAQLETCRTESMRSGGLRVTREKQR